MYTAEALVSGVSSSLQLNNWTHVIVLPLCLHSLCILFKYSCRSLSGDVVSEIYGMLYFV